MTTRILPAFSLLALLLAPPAAAATVVGVDAPTTEVCLLLEIEVDPQTLATTITFRPECLPKPDCQVTTWFVIGSGEVVDVRSDRAGVITGQGHDEEWNWGSWYTGVLCDNVRGDE